MFKYKYFKLKLKKNKINLKQGNQLDLETNAALYIVLKLHKEKKLSTVKDYIYFNINFNIFTCVAFFVLQVYIKRHFL